LSGELKVDGRLSILRYIASATEATYFCTNSIVSVSNGHLDLKSKSEQHRPSFECHEFERYQPHSRYKPILLRLFPTRAIDWS